MCGVSNHWIYVMADDDDDDVDMYSVTDKNFECKLYIS
jgi:hypothetical protein